MAPRSPPLGPDLPAQILAALAAQEVVVPRTAAFARVLAGVAAQLRDVRLERADLAATLETGRPPERSRHGCGNPPYRRCRTRVVVLRGRRKRVGVAATLRTAHAISTAHSISTAHAISAVSSPTLLLGVLYPVVGALAAGLPGVAWSLLGMLFTVVVPAAIVDLGVRHGRYTDHHLTRREQRAVPLGLAAASVAAGVAVLAVAGAPRAIVALQVAVLATLALATLVTLVWKVSLHVAVVAAAAAVLPVLGGAWWTVSWLAVPVVAWSRWRLRAHTRPQLVVGALLGAGVTLGVLMLAGVA